MNKKMMKIKLIHLLKKNNGALSFKNLIENLEPPYRKDKAFIEECLKELVEEIDLVVPEDEREKYAIPYFNSYKIVKNKLLKVNNKFYFDDCDLLFSIRFFFCNEIKLIEELITVLKDAKKRCPDKNFIDGLIDYFNSIIKLCKEIINEKKLKNTITILLSRESGINKFFLNEKSLKQYKILLNLFDKKYLTKYINYCKENYATITTFSGYFTNAEFAAKIIKQEMLKKEGKIE